MEKISEKIKILRTKSGVTQQHIASILGVDRSTYTYYELGKTVPNWPMIKKIAKIFKISPYDLLEDDNKYIASDISLSYKKKSDFYDLSNQEKKFILSLRSLPENERKKVIKSVDKLLKTLENKKDDSKKWTSLV